MICIGDFKIYTEWLPGVQGHIVRIDGPDRETKNLETVVMFTTSDFEMILLGGVKTIIADPSETFHKEISRQQQFSITIGLADWGDYSTKSDKPYYVYIKNDDVWLETYVSKEKLEIFSANALVVIDQSTRAAKVIVR